MKYISFILKNIRNLLPYFLLISIYFFFVNLEARKENKIIFDSENKNILPDIKSISDKNKSRIKIPVVPYKE